MFINNKHNYKTFSESPPVSLLHCIGNILSHSSGKGRDSLTMAALIFTFVFFYSLIGWQQRNYQLEKKMIPVPLLVFHLVQVFGTVKGFLLNNQ